MREPILAIQNLKAGVEGRLILKGINLTIYPGEVHAIMGPNGSGKSTLASVLTGRDGYNVTGGEVIFRNQDLLALEPEERAREGVFLVFQYPVEIPGVNSTYFLKTACNALRKHRSLQAPKAGRGCARCSPPLPPSWARGWGRMSPSLPTARGQIKPAMRQVLVRFSWVPISMV